MNKYANQSEISKFSQLSHDWWNTSGEFKALHKINPIRMKFILDNIYQHFNIVSYFNKPLYKINILDVGCGGGLICEPLTRLGGNVLGIDADPNAISIAKKHAKSEDLDIKYENKTLNDLTNLKAKKFDVILALEIIEHLDDIQSFLLTTKALLKKDGVIFISTLNKTFKSLLLAKIAAEYILHWVPKGTHDWQKFITPKQLQNEMKELDMERFNIKGIAYNPLKTIWALTDDTSINYITAYKNTY
tara:strand:+ start:2403 stop:3140 length:738 start_codon:yes stop_codon:yes gene_type:complete